jgi:hypothetical protein
MNKVPTITDDAALQHQHDYNMSTSLAEGRTKREIA